LKRRSVQTIGAGRFAGSIKLWGAWPMTSIPRSGWIGTFGNLAVRLSVALARSLICPASTTGTHVTPSVEKSTCPPSIGSWADDVCDDRPESYRWHFIGDIHQPLHTVGEGRGGNDVAVEVRLAGAKTCRSGPCPIMVYRSNLHRVWDSTLIKATAWSWGAYVDRLEGGWLASPEARGVDSGTPAQWAKETHRAARTVWEQLPECRVVGDAYYGKILPTLNRQLSLAGLRLARFLIDVQAPGQCVAR
jgi:hypothetical protein